MQTVVKYTCLGMWLSWLARFAHIEEVGGSSPFIPTKHRGTRRVPLCLVMSTGLEAGGNGAVALVPKTKGAVASASKQYRAAHNVLSGFLHIPDLLEN